MTGLVDDYKRDGFVLVRDGMPTSTLDQFEAHFLGLLEQKSGQRLDTMRDERFADFLLERRDLETLLYDEVRQYPWLLAAAMDPAVIASAGALIGPDLGVLTKIPLWIDLPKVVRELAVWHQDHFYVKGNIETVTAWIPLQDTPFELGCLMVMPGSHDLGPIPHDRALLGKKWTPSGVFDRPVRYVEMRRGDVLFFASTLLHSSSMNLSDRTRFSIQARYSPLGLPTDPGMGPLVPCGVRQ